MPRKKKYLTEEERKAAAYKKVAKYHKDCWTTITVRFSNKKDAEIIQKLESVENKTDYIRSLILKDLNK